MEVQQAPRSFLRQNDRPHNPATNPAPVSKRRARTRHKGTIFCGASQQEQENRTSGEIVLKE